MELEHPAITHMERTGFPPYAPRREEFGIDAMGYEVFVGEEILVINDEFFLVEELQQETKEVLEKLGAAYRIAA